MRAAAVSVMARLVPRLVAAVDGYGAGRPALWQRAAMAVVVLPIVSLWVCLDMRQEQARRAARRAADPGTDPADVPRRRRRPAGRIG